MATLPALQPTPGQDSPNRLGRFALDQDRGGAIRSAGRCDVYMGIGDTAEAISGQTLQIGQLYYFAVKPELVGRYLPTTRHGR